MGQNKLFICSTQLLSFACTPGASPGCRLGLRRMVSPGTAGFRVGLPRGREESLRPPLGGWQRTGSVPFSAPHPDRGRQWEGRAATCGRSWWESGFLGPRSLRFPACWCLCLFLQLVWDRKRGVSFTSSWGPEILMVFPAFPACRLRQRWMRVPPTRDTATPLLGGSKELS